MTDRNMGVTQLVRTSLLAALLATGSLLSGCGEKTGPPADAAAQKQSYETMMKTGGMHPAGSPGSGRMPDGRPRGVVGLGTGAR
jgi:hypothetical protein